MKDYDTSMVCRIIKVSRSDYYRTAKARDHEEIELERAVVNCFEKNKGRYGRVRIKKALFEEGIQVSENKISRLLKKYGLEAKSGRSGRRKPKRPSEEQYIEENLIKDKFSITAPNMLWCSDITELKCKGTKLYLCGVIDVATRRIVGWSIDKTQTQRLVQDAFRMALGRNPDVPEGAMFHSDRGCQYTAKNTKKLIEDSGFLKSMSRPGTPSDNQPIESFWRTLEVEMPDVRHLNFNEASRAIVSYIELYYNSQRLHSGINYLVPNDFFTLLCVHKS